jgi:hypothetical protein
MGARLPSAGVSVFEVSLGPSVLSLMFAKARSANYLDAPILLLLLFHVASIVCLIWYRHNLLISSIQFLVCCYLIFLSDTLNNFFAARWIAWGFSKNYFDEAYIFMFLFWNLPISIVAGVIILHVFVDLCKSVVVHRYFAAILLTNGTPVKRVEPADGKLKQE